MQNQMFRIRSLDPEHPSFEEEKIFSVYAIDAKHALNEIIHKAPDTRGILYAQVWCCKLRKVGYFVSGEMEPLIYAIHMRCG